MTTNLGVHNDGHVPISLMYTQLKGEKKVGYHIGEIKNQNDGTNPTFKWHNQNTTQNKDSLMIVW